MNRAEREIKRGKVIGVFLTIAVHLILLVSLGITGFKLVYPPPDERGIMLEFTEEEPVAEQIKEYGKEPQAEEIIPDKPVSLVQQSQATIQSKTSKAAESRSVGTEGDVEKFEPPQEEVIDQRSLFTSANNKKKGEGEQSAVVPSESLKAGNPIGNTPSGEVSGEPNAKLQGRSVVGKLPKPEYKVNEGGTVIVNIVVDKDGNVTSARAVKGGNNPTMNQTLWRAAEKAAMESKFSPRSNPEPQQGTIIYSFNLK